MIEVRKYYDDVEAASEAHYLSHLVSNSLEHKRFCKIKCLQGFWHCIVRELICNHYAHRILRSAGSLQ